MRLRKDSGEFAGHAVINDNTQTFSKNVGNNERTSWLVWGDYRLAVSSTGD